MFEDESLSGDITIAPIEEVREGTAEVGEIREVIADMVAPCHPTKNLI